MGDYHPRGFGAQETDEMEPVAHRRAMEQLSTPGVGKRPGAKLVHPTGDKWRAGTPHDGW